MCHTVELSSEYFPVTNAADSGFRLGGRSSVPRIENVEVDAKFEGSDENQIRVSGENIVPCSCYLEISFL